MQGRENNMLNKIQFEIEPMLYPDNDKGNLRLYYELELLKSYYETTECRTCLKRYVNIIDVLGERGSYVDFTSSLKIDKATRESDWDILLKPIPSPNEGESQDEFISRCISSLSGEESDKKKEQIAAICYNAWKDK